MNMDNTEMRKLRVIKGYTQLKMASLIGVSLNTYRNWELGANNPSEINEIKLERILKDIKEK
jgi:DNA-binding XRE family transcriptional regulator